MAIIPFGMNDPDKLFGLFVWIRGNTKTIASYLPVQTDGIPIHPNAKHKHNEGEGDHHCNSLVTPWQEETNSRLNNNNKTVLSLTEWWLWNLQSVGSSENGIARIRVSKIKQKWSVYIYDTVGANVCVCVMNKEEVVE